MLNINLIRVLITILAENGETRTLTLVKLVNSYTNIIKVREPLVFDIISDDKQLILPIIPKIMVDWGDGIVDSDTKHTYVTHNKYRVKIYNISENKLYILKSPHWANNITDFISIGRLNIISLRYMFAETKFNGIIHPNWDISSIEDLGYMFYYAKNFNQKIGDNWDTSSVKNMEYMFCGAHTFNQKIGDNWDTSRIINMLALFSSTRNFNQKIGDNWDTSNVVNMSLMFSEAIQFNQKIGDNWDTSKVTKMNCMFFGAKSFNQKIGDNWDMSNVTDIDFMFSGTICFNQKIGDNWDLSKVKKMVWPLPCGFNPDYLPKWARIVYKN